MKIDRFEIGKSYVANGAITATVIARTEKTVTFRVVYAISYYGDDDEEYYRVWEEIVTKRIFLAGSEETSLIEFTKEGGADFCNAYREDEKNNELNKQISDIYLFFELRKTMSFSDLMACVGRKYHIKKGQYQNGWRYYATAYLCDMIEEVVCPSKRVAYDYRSFKIEEFLNSFKNDEIYEYFFK